MSSGMGTKKKAIKENIALSNHTCQIFARGGGGGIVINLMDSQL